MAEKNTLSILETIKKKMKKLDSSPKVTEEPKQELDDEFEYISSGQKTDTRSTESMDLGDDDSPKFEDDLGIDDESVETENELLNENSKEESVENTLGLNDLNLEENESPENGEVSTKDSDEIDIELETHAEEVDDSYPSDNQDDVGDGIEIFEDIDTLDAKDLPDESALLEESSIKDEDLKEFDLNLDLEEDLNDKELEGNAIDDNITEIEDNLLVKDEKNIDASNIDSEVLEESDDDILDFENDLEAILEENNIEEVLSEDDDEISIDDIDESILDDIELDNIDDDILDLEEVSENILEDNSSEEILSEDDKISVNDLDDSILDDDEDEDIDLEDDLDFADLEDADLVAGDIAINGASDIANDDGLAPEFVANNKRTEVTVTSEDKDDIDIEFEREIMSFTPKSDNYLTDKSSSEIDDLEKEIESAGSSVLRESTSEKVGQSVKKLVNAKNVISGIEGFSDSSALYEIATELLEPKLKKWFDANLPDLVEKIVREEIKKIIPK